MSDATKNYIDYIEDHLKAAFDNAQMLEKYLEETEGDSDLFRKVSFYLVPSLNHWLVGAQAGNIKDLRDCLARREEEVKKTSIPGHKGDGHEVLTKK